MASQRSNTKPEPLCFQPSSSAKQRARGNSFTAVKDELLMKAWIRISEDAVIGSDQKEETFYAAVNEYFESTKPRYCTTRNVKSTERRVRKLLSKCLQFSSCVPKASIAESSGSNSEDVFQLATALFKKREVLSVDDYCGPPFKHQSCWELLIDRPKFDVLLHPPPKTTDRKHADDYEEGDTSKKEAEQFKRPVGRKRMKHQLGKADLAFKQIKVAEATLEAQREHIELLLITSKVDNYDPVVMEYMTIKRRQELQRLKAIKMASSSLEAAPSPASLHSQ